MRILLALGLVVSACAAPEAPPVEITTAAEAPPVIMIDMPAEGPNGRPNTDEEWAKAAREQRAEILAAAEATPEAKARFALMMDCGRYVSDYGSRKFFDDQKTGQPKNEACDTASKAASAAFYAEADEALTLSEMDRFQYFNSGLIQDREEFREQGEAAVQRAYLQAKAEACFAAPDLPPEISATYLTDCPIALDDTPFVK